MRRAGVIAAFLALGPAACTRTPPAPDAPAAVDVADVGGAVLIRDQAAGADDPRNFRLAGDGLRSSGSGTFSEAGFARVLDRIGTAAGGGPAVTVFDLRQEFHGYLDGAPVSWYGEHDWSNKGKAHDAVASEEAALLTAVAAGDSVRIADEAEVKKVGAAAGRAVLPVARVRSEEAVVTAAGAGYVRLTVTDSMAPTAGEVDRFITAVRGLPPGGWAHVHCHAGKGRTTTFLILLDTLHNARRATAEEIAVRQGAFARGAKSKPGDEDYNLLRPDAKAADWKRGPARDRAAFLRRFHEFAAAADPLATGAAWSDWARAHGGE